MVYDMTFLTGRMGFKNNRLKSARKFFWGRFDPEFRLNYSEERVEFLEREVSVRFFASAKAHLHTHLVSLFKKSFRLLRGAFEVVCAGRKSDAHRFHLPLFLFFSVLAFSLFA